MKHIDKIIEKFNTPDTCLVVSAWPQKKGNREVNHGVAWYTKLTLTHVAKTKGTKFVVLAEEGLDNTPELVARGKILVLRVFSPTRHSLYPTILLWLKKFTNISHVFVHSEFGAGAGLIHYGLLLPFLALIRLTGKRITYFAHNVITDITFLQTHLGIDTNPFVIDTTNLLIKLHTVLLGKLVDRIVVLDTALKDRLEKILPKKTIIASILPVAPAKRMAKATARKQLHIPSSQKVILSFGFLSAYKGSDWLVDTFDNTNKYTLILAGGPAHSLSERSHYKTFLTKLLGSAKNMPNIRITGFVPGKDIAMYFAAADLVVLPYRGLMGASGALTHALHYGKAFMISSTMNNTWKLASFPLSTTGMDLILKTAGSKKKLEALTQLSQSIANERHIDETMEKEYNQIYAPHTYEAPSKLSLLQTFGLARV